MKKYIILFTLLFLTVAAFAAETFVDGLATEEYDTIIAEDIEVLGSMSLTNTGEFIVTICDVNQLSHDLSVGSDGKLYVDGILRSP